MSHNPKALSATLRLPFEEAVDAVRAALAEQGFGVLTEIDVRETMKAKLDVDLPAYTILGACNPPLAYRGLTIDPSLGLLLPCNVVVREVAGGCQVDAVDPAVMVDFVGSAEMQLVAAEATTRLRAVIEALAGR
jgi:uncharacterized protein (DUF302 family)